jgi:hypothetical protein
MADPKEPKKETVRITLPPRPAAPSAAGARDTVRINLPVRPPATSGAPAPLKAAGGPAPARPPMVQTPLPPAPSKPVSPPPIFPPKTPAPSGAGTPAGAAAPAPLMPRTSPPVPPSAPVAGAARAPLPVSSSPGPKKETARIALLPDPPARPASSVQMKKTQPLVTMPPAAAPGSELRVATTDTEETAVEPIPMSLCWGLLAVSAVILIVQIWNYFG